MFVTFMFSSYFNQNLHSNTDKNSIFEKDVLEALNMLSKRYQNDKSERKRDFSLSAC